MLKISSILVLIMLLIPLVGCSQESNPNTQRPGLEIPSIITSIGGIEAANGSHNIQRFSYSISLVNNEKNDVSVKYIQLILPPEFERILINNNLQVEVNKSIPQKSSIKIDGSLDFNATGLTKDQIAKLNPRIISVKVLHEQTIGLVGKNAK